MYGYEPGAALVRVALATGEVTPVRAPSAGDVVGVAGEDVAYFRDGEFLRYDRVEPMKSIACSPDGRWLVAAGAWQGWAGLHRCELPGGEWAPLRGPATRVAGVTSAAFTGPDEIWATLADGTVAVWSLAGAAFAGAWSPVTWPWYGQTTLSPDGEWLAHGQGDGTVELYPWRELMAAAR